MLIRKRISWGGRRPEKNEKEIHCSFHPNVLTSVCQCAFCPLALFAPRGCAGVPVAGPPRRQARVGLLLPLGLRQLLLDLPQAGHGAVDGGRAHQVEVVHADQVQQEVAAEVAADDVSASGLCEEHDGLIHLVVRDEAVGKRGGEGRADVWFLFGSHIYSTDTI